MKVCHEHPQTAYVGLDRLVRVVPQSHLLPDGLQQTRASSMRDMSTFRIHGTLARFQMK